MRRRNALAYLAWAALVLTAGSARAAEVYLNGVQITGAKDQVIEKARVELDKNGDVRILAPEYKVREVGSVPSSPSPAAPVATAATARLTKGYFVVTEVAKPGATGYIIQVIVNNKLLQTLTDDIPQNIVELNDHLQKGSNTISFRAIRPEGKSAQSISAADTFTVVLGEGKGLQGETLTIENVLGEFQVTAFDQGERAKTFTITAK